MTSSRPTTCSSGPLVAPRGATASLSADEFGRLRDLLASYCGVYLDKARQRVLEQGLARRLEATGSTLPAYEQNVRAPGEQVELRRLAELVLNHETLFFRNLPHMQALREVLLAEIDRRKPAGAPIRIWSAGCATGEEAYSLAITALEALGYASSRPLEIWATDLSEPALHKAQEGFYRGRALQNVPPDVLRRYFLPRAEGYAIGDELRALVRFENLNLLDPFPPAANDIDIIFCQNVTIYFQLETCRQLIARFYECLPEQGLLFLGFSETLWNLFDRLHTREIVGSYVYYKATLEPADQARTANPQSSGSASASRIAPADRRRAEGPVRRPRPTGSTSVSSSWAVAFHDHTQHEQADAEALDRGRALLDEGAIDQALEVLRRIPPQSARAPHALTLIARAHADRDDLDLAAAEVQRAIEIDALNEEPYLLLGMIYSRQGQWPEAIRQLERARYLNAGSALISFHLAGAYHQASFVEKAAREYRNTLRKLDQLPPGQILDGVAVGWLRETCERRLECLHPSIRL